jgi:hypothetical protein
VQLARPTARIVHFALALAYLTAAVVPCPPAEADVRRPSAIAVRSHSLQPTPTPTELKRSQTTRHEHDHHSSRAVAHAAQSSTRAHHHAPALGGKAHHAEAADVAVDSHSSNHGGPNPPTDHSKPDSETVQTTLSAPCSCGCGAGAGSSSPGKRLGPVILVNDDSSLPPALDAHACALLPGLVSRLQILPDPIPIAA